MVHYVSIFHYSITCYEIVHDFLPHLLQGLRGDRRARRRLALDLEDVVEDLF